MTWTLGDSSRRAARQRRADANAWTERYMFTSTTGRIYDRRMILSAAVRIAVRTFAREDRPTRAQLSRVIGDHDFMVQRRGEIPTRVAEAVVSEAFARRPRIVLDAVPRKA